MSSWELLLSMARAVVARAVVARVAMERVAAGDGGGGDGGGDKVEVTVLGVARWSTVSMAVYPNQVPGDRSNSLLRVDRRLKSPRELKTRDSSSKTAVRP